MSHLCKCCGKPSDTHLLIECCVCQQYNVCVNIIHSEITLINSLQKSLSWRCIACHQVANALNALNAAVMTLKDEIKGLKNSCGSSSLLND